MATKKADLTPKQKRFCEEYLIDLNATQAAIRSGYSPKTARSVGAENLTKPNIKNFIAERLKAIDDAKIMDAVEAMRMLTSIARGELEQDVYDMFGNCFQRKPTIKERTTALELIGKRHSLFTDKLKMEGAVPVVICGADELEDG